MDVKINLEIKRLEELKNLRHREYIFNVEQSRTNKTSN